MRKEECVCVKEKEREKKGDYYHEKEDNLIYFLLKKIKIKNEN